MACGAEANGNGACPGCERHFGAVDHRVTFDAGSMSGMTFRIPNGIFILGRDALSPRDYHLSRQHLSVSHVNGAVYVADAGSANGTRVDGQFAEAPVLLKHGVELTISSNKGIYTRNERRT